MEYGLTELGRSMFEPLSELLNWVTDNFGAVSVARAKFDRAEQDLARCFSHASRQ